MTYGTRKERKVNVVIYLHAPALTDGSSFAGLQRDGEVALRVHPRRTPEPRPAPARGLPSSGKVRRRSSRKTRRVRPQLWQVIRI